ncbi:MAG TPA: NUDIX domain-containing protein [Gemmatimonadales bacterium]
MTATLRGPTISKTDALYRPADDPARSCGTCSMFLAAERACTLVRGKIKAKDTCDYWRAQTQVAKHLAELPLTDWPHLGHDHVRVVLIDATGRLLLLQRADRPTQWEVVQGAIESGETPRRAAERELDEETGYGGDSLTWRQVYGRCWVVTLPPGAGVPRISDEHTAYRWMPPPAAAQWLAREEFYGRIVDRAERTPCDYGPVPRLSEDQEISLHEGAHCVVATLMLAPVREVLLNPVPPTPGAHVRGEMHFDPAVSHGGGHLVATLAARAVDFRLGVGPLPSEHDVELAKGLAEALTGGDPVKTSALLEAAGEAAREWVHDPETWRQIEAVAEALLEKRTLSGEEVKQIMADVLAGVGP